MTAAKRQNPSAWQRRAIDGIAARLSGDQPARAALLQLPTGFGKSLVAVRVFEKLREKTQDLRLVVVLPKQVIPTGWRAALRYRPNDKVKFFEWHDIPGKGGKVCFQTRLKLKRAMIEPTPGWPRRLARTLHASPHLVVIDEMHRHRDLIETLSTIFLSSEEDRKGAEAKLSAPFRPPSRGRRTWPRWLLLSATPYNPVRLDCIDPIDNNKTVDTYELREFEDEEALADELERTLGALAELSGLRRDEWFNAHIHEARKRLSNGDPGRHLRPPRRLVVWPPTLRSAAFRVPKVRRWTVPKASVDEARIDSAIEELVSVAKAIEQAPKNEVRRRATSERFVLSGGELRVEGHRIQDHIYGPSLVRTVGVAVEAQRSAGVQRPTKLEALVEFIRDRVGQEHVLIFCVHRAVAAAVVETLRHALDEVRPGAFVRKAIGHLEEGDQRWFNRRTEGTTRALVATDACSESIDLHERADILVHYELPWSPLRALQRVGRLWRIRSGEGNRGKLRTPRLPGIVHFAHPGSVDEEIISRLKRRWGHLGVLGLDYLSYDEALGVRLPPVPKEWESGS